MPRPRRTFTDDYKAEAVALTKQAGKTVSSVAHDLSLTPGCLRAWVKQAAIDAGARAGVTSDERAELTRLRKELREVRMERDLLKKATAFYARECL